MRIILIALVLLIQERATLNTPTALGSITEYQVVSVGLTRPKTIGIPSGNWNLSITYYDDKDNIFIDNHSGVFHAVTNPNGADVLVIALNKANLSTRALNCRALDHLIAENKIPASNVVCTPQ